MDISILRENYQLITLPPCEILGLVVGVEARQGVRAIVAALDVTQGDLSPKPCSGDELPPVELLPFVGIQVDALDVQLAALRSEHLVEEGEDEWLLRGLRQHHGGHLVDTDKVVQLRSLDEVEGAWIQNLRHDIESSTNLAELLSGSNLILHPLTLQASHHDG